MVITKPEKKEKGIEFLKALVEKNDLLKDSVMSVRWWPDKRDEKTKKMEAALKNTAKGFLGELKGAEEKAMTEDVTDWDSMTIR